MISLALIVHILKWIILAILIPHIVPLLRLKGHEKVVFMKLYAHMKAFTQITLVGVFITFA